MSFLRENLGGDLIFVRVTTNAVQTKIGGKFIDEKNQEYLKINVAAVPEKGMANEELIKFLAKKLKIPQSKIEIIRGETSRLKVLKLHRQDNDPKAFPDLARLYLQLLSQ
ncbi:MAG: DUF167 domain-containing protein [Proteobacteria bacterium]|nr:DUF167 domain-containing protein [Pseudomonadota bacterium]